MQENACLASTSRVQSLCSSGCVTWRSTIRYLSTAHRIAPYPISVPTIPDLSTEHRIPSYAISVPQHSTIRYLSTARHAVRATAHRIALASQCARRQIVPPGTSRLVAAYSTSVPDIALRVRRSLGRMLPVAKESPHRVKDRKHGAGTAAYARSVPDMA
eukprot:1920854-Rhodomonas_salina.2